MKTVLVLNGPNLSMLGAREPDVYGSQTLEDLRTFLTANSEQNTNVDVRQTDSEAEMIAWVHEAFENEIDVIINPAAFTHYSYALRDALAMLEGKSRVIEVHISNPSKREVFRHNSVISGVAHGVIAGFGFDSYRLALESLKA